jgi:hypothetical protein
VNSGLAFLATEKSFNSIPKQLQKWGFASDCIPEFLRRLRLIEILGACFVKTDFESFSI